ncbi:MAG: WYL domain-containing protein [Campylobacterota bacterium]|nr:WYL domain-containing protein [Campylobacterota bacterium]
MPKEQKYDRILTRLVKILTMLSQDERPTTSSLALEFSVSQRTIQSDIYKRLLSFSIEKDSLGRFKFAEGFSLDKSMLDNHEMILLSLALSNFKDVQQFDKTSQSILQKLLYPNFFNPYYIKKEELEKLNIDSIVVKRVEDAIKSKNIIHIESDNSSVEVEAYKITAYDGFWYLFARDIRDMKIKTFMLSNIKEVVILEEYHKSNLNEIEQILESTHSAWFDDGEAYEVTIEVYPEIAEYFLKRNFLQSQEIVKEKDDGTLIIRFEITHDEDLDNIIKSWLPHIKVLTPERFRDKIRSELQSYLQTY